MNPTPSPETPSRAMVREVAGHPLQRRAVLATILSALAGLPVLVTQLHAIPGLVLPGWLEVTLGAVAVVSIWVTPFLNSLDAADQAARAAVRGPGEDGLGSGTGGRLLP
jgi:hypothetical protein